MDKHFTPAIHQNIQLVLAAQALILAPYLTLLPFWIAGFSLLLVVAKFYFSRHSDKPIGQFGKIVFALIGFGLVMFTFQRVVGREGGSALLIITLGLKLHEFTKLRDFHVWLCANFFLIATTFLSSQSMLYAAYMLTCVVMLTTLLIRCTRTGNQQKALVSDMKLAGKLLGLAVPVAFVFFVLFPRIPGPLWAIPEDAGVGVTGLSDSMSPGQISELLQNNATAFRVNFNSSLPMQQDLYWRGPVIWDFNGTTWRNTQKQQSIGRDIRPFLPNAKFVDYEILLESHPEKWLYALDWPVAVNYQDTHIDRDGQVHYKFPVTQRVRYEASSSFNSNVLPVLSASDRQRALRVPPHRHSEARELAAQWRQQYPSQQDIVNAALLYFNEQPFKYTLKPKPLGLDPIDSFLFETREGFCEYYSSSFTVLMRLAGIPARVVTGFQGGEYNPNDDYLIVRYADAHAWSEVWLEDRGWVRIDPTSAVAPERVEQGIQAAIEDLSSLPFFARSNNTWLNGLRLKVDSLNHSWNRWIIGYNRDKQLAFLSRFGITSWSKMGIALGLLFVAALLFLSLYLLRNKPRETINVAAVYFQKFYQLAAKYDLNLSRQDTPNTIAAKFDKQFPHAHKELIHLSHLLNRLMFSNVKLATTLQKRACQSAYTGVIKKLREKP